MVSWALAMLAACSSATTTSSPERVASPLDAGWIAQVVAEPSVFTQVIDAGPRDAWVAFHQGQWATAASLARDPTLRARAQAEHAQLYQDLAALEAETWPKLSALWVQRDPRQAEGPLPFLAALSLAAANQPDAALSTPGLDPRQQVAIQALCAGPALPDGPGLDPGGCLEASIQLWRGEAGAEPCDPRQTLELPGDGDFTNPIALAAAAARARRAVEATSASAPPTGDGVNAQTLFGEAWTSEVLAALALPDSGTTDDAQLARERVRALDAALLTWSTELQARASEDGTALLGELGLVDAARNRIVVGWAREALAADRPHQAAALLMLAHDVEHARQITPENHPQRFALAALADLRTGRGRQALDHLSALDGAVPELPAVVEALGDLVVLEGLGRSGDSKEH